MEWQQLKYFCEVAKTEHITQASQSLHISQPSLSTSIRRLEAELGTTLFDRKGRSIRLNSYGKIFLSKVAPATDLVQEGLNEIASLKNLENNQISISTPSLSAEPEMMEAIMSLYPQLIIRQMSKDKDEIECMLKNSTLDFCITSLDLNIENVCCQTLRKEEMILFMNRNHRLAQLPEIDLSQCVNEVFISNSPGTSHWYMVKQCCAQMGFEPRITYTGASIHDTFKAVDLGFCIVLISENAARVLMPSDFPNLVAVRLSHPLFETMKIYWPSNRNERPLVSAVRNTMIKFYNHPPGNANQFLNMQSNLPF